VQNKIKELYHNLIWQIRGLANYLMVFNSRDYHTDSYEWSYIKTTFGGLILALPIF
jgi:hypothetical protein